MQPNGTWIVTGGNEHFGCKKGDLDIEQIEDVAHKSLNDL